MSGDRHLPYLWDDADIVSWLNDGEIEACIRGRLIREDADPVVCRIALDPSIRAYALHPAVYEIINLRILSSSSDRPRGVALKSREWLDEHYPDWRDMPRPSEWAVQDDTKLVMVGQIAAGEVLALECYRLPLAPMSLPDPLNPLVVARDTPEIHQAHHERLIDWALHRAYSIVDAETFDPARAGLAEGEFTRYFGLRPDCDLRRACREDILPHTYLFLP